MTTLRLLTLNVWGIHYLASKIRERLGYIAEELKNYDIIALQEVWSMEDFSFLIRKLEHTFPHRHIFSCGAVGSGLCVFSRHPIAAAFSHRFSNSGAIDELADGEICVGKGVLGCWIVTPEGRISLYNLHCNPRCRDSQLFEVFQFVERTRGNNVVIVTGDFNTKSRDDAYSLMTKCLGLQDVFEDGPDTCDLKSNIFTLKKMTPKRIDFILYSDKMAAEHTLTLKSKSLALSGHIPGKSFPWSDHEGVEAVFSLVRREFRIEIPERVYDDASVQVFLKVSDNLLRRQSKYKTTHRRVIGGWVFLSLFSLLSVILLSSQTLYVFLAGFYLHWLPALTMGLIGAGSVLRVFSNFIGFQAGRAMEENMMEIQTLLKYNTLQREMLKQSPTRGSPESSLLSHRSHKISNQTN